MEVKEKETLILLFFPNPLPFVSRPEKLDLEKVVSIDQLKKKISPLLFYKETYVGAKEGKLFCINLLNSECLLNLNFILFYFLLLTSFSSRPMSVLRNGMYSSLYEVVEKSRSGSHLEGLLQKLEKEKLVSVTDFTIPF